MIIVNLAIKNEDYCLSNFNKLSIQAKFKIELIATIYLRDHSTTQRLTLLQIPLIHSRYKNLYNTKIAQNYQTQLAHYHFRTDLDTTDQ